jgi:hypothetical protein
VVPAALSGNSGTDVDLVVQFGYGSGSTMLSSTPFQLTVADTNPGVFTVGGNGQGDGAILSGSTLALVTSGGEAGMRTTAADSDVVQLFVTGLGLPNSAGNNATAGSAGTWGTDCVSTTTYLDSLNIALGSAVSTMDGVILNSALLNTNRLVPCITSAASNVPAVTIGGVAGTVTYAGWVPDNVAGLYQINVRLPGAAAGGFTNSAGTAMSAITTPVQLPVVVTSASKTSQARVNLWVARRLKVVGPSGAGLTGTVGVAWSASNNSVTATQGTSPYRYAVTSGLLPAGLSLNPTTGAISGTPAADTSGSYQVTVTATDSANFPISDRVTFTLTVAGGLVLSTSSAGPYSEVYSIADPSITTISATGGIFPYSYAITSSPVPVGLTVDANTGVLGVSSVTPAGTYNVTVTGTDSTPTTPLTGSSTFSLGVALRVVVSTPATPTAGNAATITTATATGQTGTVAYSLDTASAALSWLSINPSTGVISVTNASVASTRTVTVTATDDTAAAGSTGNATGTVSFTLTIN